MRRITYVATFEGSATPANDAGTELKAATRAPSLIPLAGSELPPGVGPGGSFESLVIFGEGSSFAENGRIELGSGNALQFRELAPGTIAPAPDGRAAGAIDWIIESGTGAFEGATGYITSNFSVGPDGDVVDHQVASLLLP